MTSPAKRRALAPLDANANTASSPRQCSSTAVKSVSSPVEIALEAKKRVLESSGHDAENNSPSSGKKPCLESEVRSQSQSPDTSSVFDNSTIDTSYATATTEPDLVVPATAITTPVRSRPRALTRDEAREKAQILRLRLGLASYKVRTGQTTVSLADLQPRPLPPSSSPHRRVPISPSTRSEPGLSTTPIQSSPSREQVKTEEARQHEQQQQEEEKSSVDEHKNGNVIGAKQECDKVKTSDETTAEEGKEEEGEEDTSNPSDQNESTSPASTTVEEQLEKDQKFAAEPSNRLSFSRIYTHVSDA